jgi:hypothetical protein
MERLSRVSLDDVRIHYNSASPAAMGARAYAQGGDIHVGPGEEAHLPHEAWHVVQQKQGRVKPTLMLKGVAVNDETALEAEADAMGAKAMAAGRSAAAASAPGPTLDGPLPRRSAPVQQVAQRMITVVTPLQVKSVEQWERLFDPDGSDPVRAAAVRRALLTLNGRHFATTDALVSAVAREVSRLEPVLRRRAEAGDDSDREDSDDDVSDIDPDHGPAPGPSSHGSASMGGRGSAKHDAKSLLRPMPIASAGPSLSIHGATSAGGGGGSAAHAHEPAPIASSTPNRMAHSAAPSGGAGSAKKDAKDEKSKPVDPKQTRQEAILKNLELALSRFKPMGDFSAVL